MARTISYILYLLTFLTMVGAECCPCPINSIGDSLGKCSDGTSCTPHCSYGQW
ncbi:hypothetical protein BD779DRAFT_1568789 [Infundibulicybe gibba]|nr:hypothetical protein BD779DRAFT_1568789 [Infundibulicybe gibba]